MSPLDGYLENEKLSYSQLIQFVKSMGQQAKKPFREALTNVSEKVLEREAEYYDDFYFFRNKVYSDMEKHFSEVDPLVEVKKTLELIQFDLSKINFDVDNRKNKYPSPICFFMQVQMIFVYYIKLKVHILIFKDVSMKLVTLYMQPQLMHH